MGNYNSTLTVDMNSREATMIKKTVEAHPVVIFSKTYCPYCRRAKSVLDGAGVPSKVMELDRMKDGDNMQNVLEKMTQARTVPRVFINGQCIGGCSELLNLEKTGKLREMINE